MNTENRTHQPPYTKAELDAIPRNDHPETEYVLILHRQCPVEGPNGAAVFESARLRFHYETPAAGFEAIKKALLETLQKLQEDGAGVLAIHPWKA